MVGRREQWWVIPCDGGREEEGCGEKEGDRCRVVTSGCLRGWESNKGVRGRTGADALALNPGLPLLGFVFMGGINS